MSSSKTNRMIIYLISSGSVRQLSLGCRCGFVFNVVASERTVTLNYEEDRWKRVKRAWL
jgi:hypothetical protein